MFTEVFLFISGCIFFPSVFKLIVYLQKLYFKDELSDASVFSIATRTVSAIQAVFACVAGLIIIYNCKDVIYDSHWLTLAYNCFGAPYFYYDTWAMYHSFWAKHPHLHSKPLKHKLYKFVMEQPLMMCHHLVFPIIFFPVIVYFRGGLGDFFIGCFYCIEFAVPCLSLRTILLHLKKEKTLLYAVNGLVLIITYTCSRVLIFPFMYSSYGQQKNQTYTEVIRSIPIKCNVSCGVLLAMHIYWLYQMLIIFFKTVYKKFSKAAVEEAEQLLEKMQ